jgi:hypothetical protein
MKDIEFFLADYMALCMYHKLMITSCCGKPFLKEVKDEESLKKFMDELREEVGK